MGYIPINDWGKQTMLFITVLVSSSFQKLMCTVLFFKSIAKSCMEYFSRAEKCLAHLEKILSGHI